MPIPHATRDEPRNPAFLLGLWNFIGSYCAMRFFRAKLHNFKSVRSNAVHSQRRSAHNAKSNRMGLSSVIAASSKVCENLSLNDDAQELVDKAVKLECELR
jgi:hypothetical protein